MSAAAPDWIRTLSRLDCNSPGGVTRPVHLLTELVKRGGETDLSITLTDGKNVWLGSIDTKQLMEYGSKHNFESIEEYLSVTHAALTGKSLAPPSGAAEGEEQPWEFELKTEDGNLSNVSFVWKKPLSSGIKVHYGAVDMARQEGGVTGLLDQIIAEIGRRDARVDQYREESSECERQREEALGLVKRAVEGKEEYEQEMIHGFSLALNKKKEKIRCLKEELKLVNRIRSGADLRNSDSGTEGEDSSQLSAPNPDSAVETGKKPARLKARITEDKEEDDVIGPPLKKRTRVSKGTPKDLPKDSTQPAKQKGRAASRKSKTSLDTNDLIKDM